MKEILFVVFLYTMGIITIMIPTNGNLEYFIAKIIIGIILIGFVISVGLYIVNLIDGGRK